MSDTTYMVKVTYESERSLRGKRTGAHKVVEFLAASEREAHLVAALVGPRKYAPIRFEFNGVSESWEAFQLERLGREPAWNDGLGFMVQAQARRA